MGCIYSDNDGFCTLSDLDEETDEYTEICTFEDDPNPADSCENYESDWTCHDCGVDLNVEECQCVNED